MCLLLILLTDILTDIYIYVGVSSGRKLTELEQLSRQAEKCKKA